MGLIRVLSAGLVNRIAAGECVERPASVVKELVENSLDAGAARIDVTILDGGRQLVQVVDDGVGMEADDLRLCVQPHATSKIRDDDDLFNIHTMGFRGEALPSIGSVARVQVTSRTRDSDIAHTIRVDAGQIGEPTPCAGPPGTNVEVRDLFYCVPARRKFLKTNQTEMGHITEHFARLALAHPGVAFSLRHNKRVFHTLAATNDRRRRIADFYGPELAEVLLPVRREGGGVLVEGWVAPPKESRGSGKWEYVFVNGRYVRDRFVSHAVKEAYRSLIDPSRYPVAFLFITIDPSQVDVNVHPTKIELRWRDSNYVHAQVLAALREKFLATNLDHTLQTQAGQDEAYRERVRKAMVDFFTRGGGGTGAGGEREEKGGEKRGAGRGAERGEERGEGRGEGRGGQSSALPPSHEDNVAAGLRAGRQSDEAEAGHEGTEARSPAGISDFRSQMTEQASPGAAPGQSEPRSVSERSTAVGLRPDDVAAGLRAGRERDEGIADFGLPIAGSRPPAAEEPAVVTRSGQSAIRIPQSPIAGPAPRAVQIHNTFIVAETDDGLMIIDQHALHERILYEQFRARIAERPLESQRLLLPEVVRVPADRIEALETHADVLERLGIELTPSGPQSVTLHAFPTLLERVDRPRFVRDLLDLLSEQGSRPSTETLIHDVLDMMACKAAVKAGDPLSPDEIAALLARRELAERSSHCPHGRPTTLHLTLRDLERQFKRR